MRLTCILIWFVLFAILVSSCQSEREKKLLNLLNNSEKFNGKPTGQIVSLKLAQQCFRAYDSVMNLRGFVDTPGNTPITLNLQQQLRITRREAFRGKELVEFLGKAAYRHEIESGNGAENMNVQIALGLYTENYLRSVMPGTYDGSKLNRIGVFLVTCKRDPADNKWAPFQYDDDPSAFDFGGLEP